MNLNNLNTYPINQLSKQKFSCSCGQTHEIISNIAFDNISEKIDHYIEKIIPPLSLISIIYNHFSKEKYGRVLDKKLGNAGYRVNSQTKETVGQPFCHSIIPEDTRLILGIGSHSHQSEIKQLAYSLNIPYAFIPSCPSSHLLSLAPSYSLENPKNTFDIFKVSPPALVLCEAAKNNYQSAVADNQSAIIIPQAGSYFSLLSSKLVSLFDYQAAALLNAEKFCPDIFDQALAIIDEATCDALTIKNQFELEHSLKEKLIRYGALCQLKGNTRLVLGAEVTSAKIFSALTHYSGENTGENEFLLARVLMRLYVNYLQEENNFFTPPPSNNERANLISSLLKIQEQTVLEKMRPLPNLYEENLALYKLKTHRQELFALATEFDAKLTLAFSSLKKLYLDEGYSLINYLTKKESAFSISLAPDLAPKFTFLSFMKDRGLLESMLASQ
ncbi:MAG: hypothetical protein FWE22_08035 [Firmicutes bacterium]|nr:hypothetical protein [Bacillota bacterium]